MCGEGNGSNDRRKEVHGLSWEKIFPKVEHFSFLLQKLSRNTGVSCIFNYMHTTVGIFRGQEIQVVAVDIQDQLSNKSSSGQRRDRGGPTSNIRWHRE